MICTYLGRKNLLEKKLDITIRLPTVLTTHDYLQKNGKNNFYAGGQEKYLQRSKRFRVLPHVFNGNPPV